MEDKETLDKKDKETLDKKVEELEKIEKQESEKSGSPIIEAAKVENDRREKLLAEENKLQDRKEKLQAEEIAGGRANAGETSEKKKELTDIEYAEALERGAVNPLKEDGFI